MSKILSYIILCGLFSVATIYSQINPSSKRPWGPEQATGAPDTKIEADFPNAWAPLLPDAGEEWLEVTFANKVEIDEIRIRETFNAGAISKIVATPNNQQENILWDGEASGTQAPTDVVVKPVRGISSDRIKIHLDTSRVPGWQEIDAVELVGTDGSRQWAQSATASSFLAESNETGLDRFVFDLFHVNQKDADKYLVLKSNVKKYSEWQNPPVTYWGPMENGVDASLTYKFPLPAKPKKIDLIAHLASFNFANGGGKGSGHSSLWGSKDGKNWILLLDNPVPDRIDSYKKFTGPIPAELLGEEELWMQLRFRTEGAPNSSYTCAQFARSSSDSKEPVFSIRTGEDKSISAGEKEMIFVQGGKIPQGSELAGQEVATFQIGKHEVTWGLWKEVRDWAVGNTKGYDLADVGNTYPAGKDDDYPVVRVSWYDAVKWCNARSEKEGLTPVYNANWQTYKSGQMVPTINKDANGYRLLTETEWEWAARGGVSSKGYTYSGSNDPNTVAWTSENSNQQTHPVGTKAANELGIHDMSGNAFEWCWDQINANRRLRGGSWFFGIDRSASNTRDGLNPDARYRPFGFRIAKNVN